MEREPIVNDNKAYKLRIADTDEVLNARFDRIDYFQGFGHYILRVAQPEGGPNTYHIKEEVAKSILDQTDIPLALRETISESEYDAYLRFTAKNLDDSWLD